MAKRIPKHPDKKRRQEEAKEREANYRSPKDQLAYLDSKKFRAEKERAKLKAKITNKHKKKEKPE